MKDKLKPCPFCGNKEIVVDTVAKYFDIVSYSTICFIDIHCNVCGTKQRTSVLEDKETDCVEEAIKSWNRRVKRK